MKQTESKNTEFRYTQSFFLGMAEDLLGDAGDGAIWAMAEQLAGDIKLDLYSLPVQ